VIDKVSLLTAIRARLTGDATLMALVGGVFQLRVPSTVTWTLPVLEMGEQAGIEDEANGYTQRGEDLRLRLMAHDRGDAPGVGSTDDLYAALRRADTVLLATPITASNQTVWSVRRESAVPGAVQDDDQGYLRFSAGSIYRVRSHE
jgi:hypothetical protein